MARLINVKDVTELAARQELVATFTAGGVIAFLSLVLVGLSYYMSRSFALVDRGCGCR